MEKKRGSERERKGKNGSISMKANEVRNQHYAVALDIVYALSVSLSFCVNVRV